MTRLRTLAAGAVRQALRDSGRLPAEVARAVGCSPRALQRALDGRHGTTDLLDRIAAELRVEWRVDVRRAS